MHELPTGLLIAIAGVFVSVGLVSGLVVSRLLAFGSPEQRRLRQVAAQPALAGPAGGGAGVASLLGGPGGRRSRWVPKSVREMSRLERRVTRAGYRSPWAASAVAIAELALPVAAALAAIWWFGWREPTGWIAAGLGAIVGRLAPGFWIERRTAQRRRQVQNGLPDVLDLLIICLEAGSSLDESIVKATQELAIAYPALTEELRTVTTETRAGKPRLEAFRNFAQRTNVEDVRALVSMLTQTDRFGTSVGQALRTLAESMRTRRQQIAEEKANKVGVKLVFPLVLCLFPAFFVVILGPAMLRLTQALSGVGQ